MFVLGFVGARLLPWLRGRNGGIDPLGYVPANDYDELRDAYTQLEGCYARAMSDRNSLIWACERALDLLEHGTPVRTFGHRCGDPNASCDSDCVQAADFDSRFHQVKSTLRCVKGKT